MVAGSLVNFASFGFAPQSLLASLGSVQFISNVIFGKVRRTGPLWQLDYYSTVVIVLINGTAVAGNRIPIGVLMLISHGNYSTGWYPLWDLINLIIV